MNFSKNVISMLGLTLLLSYVVTKIFNFYGVTAEYYGIYLVFYVFILFCIFIFPTNYQQQI